MVDEIFQRDGRITGVLFVDFGEFPIVFGAAIGWHLGERCLEPRALTRTRGFRQIVFFSHCCERCSTFR